MQGKRSNQIVQNTAFLYFRMLLSMGIGLYASRIVLEVLGVEDFGVFNVVGGVVSMLTFLNNSLSSASQRFLTFELGKNNIMELSKVFNISVSIHLAIAGLVVLLAETVGLWFLYHKLSIPPERFDAALWVYHFCVLTAFFGILQAPYIAMIISREEMSLFAYISILETVLRLLIVYLLKVIMFDKLSLYGILTFSVSFFIFLLYWQVCRKRFVETRIKHFIWDRKRSIQILSFSGWVLNGNLAVVGYTQGVNILLNIFFGPAVNAARGIAFQLQNAVNNFSYNFQKAMNPQITKSYASGDMGLMHRLVFVSSKVTFFLTLIPCIPILIETNFFLEKWLGKFPDHTISFVRISVLITIISALSYSMIVSIHSTGTIKKFQLWEANILLMIVPISYFLLKKGGTPEVAYWTTLVLMIIAQSARVVIVSKAIDFKLYTYFNEVILRILLGLPLCLILPYWVFVNMNEGWSRLIILVVVVCISVGLSFYFLVCSKSEQRILNKVGFGFVAKFQALISRYSLNK